YLIIHSFTSEYPWVRMLREGIFAEVNRLPMEERPEIFEEQLDAARLGTAATSDTVAHHLTQKYAAIRFDGIVTELQEAAMFLLDRPALFPRVPRYYFDFAAKDIPVDRPSQGTFVTLPSDWEITIATILQVLPDTRHIVVIGDHWSEHPQARIRAIRSIEDRFAGKATMEYWEEFSFAELYDRVKTLPAGTAILYLSTFRDKLGQRGIPALVGPRLSLAASVPVFSVADSILGGAILGGYMPSADKEGRLIGRILIAGSDQPLRLTPEQLREALTGYYFEDSQLKRWGIPDQRLPKGSVILHREKTLWESYRGYFIATIVAFFLETLLIVALIRSNRQRKREQQAAQESEARFHVLVEDSPIPIVLGRDMRIIYANGRFAGLLGQPDAAELQGLPLASALAPVSRATFADSVRTLSSGTAAPPFELNALRRDGSEFPCQVTISRIELADGPALLAYVQDITERKRADEEIVRYRDHLEEMVRERTAQLAEAKNRAEEANRAKSQFLANMSHELRTPLNAILGFSSFMQRDPQLTPAQKENLSIINRSGEHLLTLINDVLDMAKIESGRLVTEIIPFDLGELVRDIAEMMRGRAEEKQLQLLLEPSSRLPLVIRSDQGKIRQILINLLSNAVKYTEQGGVTLRLEATLDAPEPRLIVEVEDTGVGIDPADQRRIFDAFVQVGRSDRQKGTGLGLAITRQFVQLMGGKLTVDSTPGKGSLFRIDLPIQPALPEDIASIPHSGATVFALAPGQPDYRILVVEDQLENQLLLRRLLETVGFQVRVAQDGAEGVEMFKSWQPHFIWMDRRMPVMDGLEATRRIRALEGGAAVKIVAITASVFKEQHEEMTQAGLDDLVRKPYRSEEVFQCLSKHLGVRFVYQDDASATAPPYPELKAEDLENLPQELREELMDAVTRLHEERIGEVVRRIAAWDADLGKRLQRYAANLEYTQILRALQYDLRR
ncbi:MAG: response regulator, partial [Methylococcaceae bacterium]|nr:response regulator [Methylococcaceae bacterium]